MSSIQTNHQNTPPATLWGTASQTKALVYFHDGNERTFFSRDSSDRFAAADPRALGLARLRRMIEKWGRAVNRAIIYDRVTDGEVARFENGCWK